MLITNKNRMNETLKNPEKMPFPICFLPFLPLFISFLRVFRFLVVILQRIRIS